MAAELEPVLGALLSDLVSLLAEEDAGGELYSIAIVATRVAVHPNTLRNYERDGLLVPQRSAGRFRQYSEADIRRAQVLRRLMGELRLSADGARLVLHILVEAAARELELRRQNEALRTRLAAARASAR